MPEFMVQMEFNFPPTMTIEEMQGHYTAEAYRAAELADAGLFKRVWRIPGRRGHISIWECDTADQLHRALETWPMFMFMDIQVTAFAVNHNDPGGVAEELPEIKFTYPVLREIINMQPGDAHHGHGENGGIDLGEGISIHDHPGTDRSLQIHVMCDGQKIAEIGPPQPEKRVSHDASPKESVVPGYIDFLAEWEGRPVRHARWQRRIEHDNHLDVRSYEDALHGSRYSRPLIIGQ